MDAQELRQANRIIRNAIAAKQRLNDMINELQDAKVSDNDAHDWESTWDHLLSVEATLPLLFDLTRNIQRSISEKGR